MQNRNRVMGVAVITGLVLALSSSVWANGFGDFQRLLFRGSEYAGNNLFLSNPQGGPLYDHNRFEQRVEFNRAGQGYTYESFKFFGPDSFGNLNTLDLGPFKIQLSNDPNVTGSTQPGGIHNRIGYTTTFIPELTFSSQSGTRAYNQFSGISSFAPAPLQYTVSLNTGFQDFQWSGNIMIDSSGQINALGFYDFDLRLTNVGDYEADGFVLQDEQVTDFDLGPINVSGNIAMDAVAGLFQAIGMTGDAVPARTMSGAAQKDKTQDLLAKLEAGENLGDEEIEYLVQQMFMKAISDDPLGFMQNGFPSEIEGFEGLSLALSEAETTGTGAAVNEMALVPEPGVLGLLFMAAVFLAVFPSLHRRLA